MLILLGLRKASLIPSVHIFGIYADTSVPDLLLLLAERGVHWPGLTLPTTSHSEYTTRLFMAVVPVAEIPRRLPPVHTVALPPPPIPVESQRQQFPFQMFVRSDSGSSRMRVTCTGETT